MVMGDIRADDGGRENVRWLTYEEAGRVLGIDADSVSRRARRLRWRRQPGNDGRPLGFGGRAGGGRGGNGSGGPTRGRGGERRGGHRGAGGGRKKWALAHKRRGGGRRGRRRGRRPPPGPPIALAAPARERRADA